MPLQLKIGIHLPSLGQSLRRALTFAAKAGARGVVLAAQGDLRPGSLSQTGIRSLRKLLEDLRLKVVAVEFNTRRGYADLDNLEPRVDATRQVMDFAFAMRTPLVLNHIGQIPSSEESTEWSTLVEVLSDLGIYAQRAGAWLTANAASCPPDDFSRLWQALPEGSLLIDLDPALAVMNGHPPLDYIGRFGNQIAHVHARDATRDARSLRGVETTLGRGEVDFPVLLAALEEVGYQGYLTLERGFSNDPAFEIERGAMYLRQLIAE
ncbi:MAG: sugar phosphate isomerase/epimerase [Pirellulales bacterium]|nr:sugar phosphate isomerase/epimerase [Pirellulales bacterium]